MRYIKVLLLVILFFLVMMFFVQNQSAFSQAVALKLDLLFLPPVESAPLPFYTLLIICFVLGALCILAMLMWDRVSLSAGKRVRQLCGGAQQYLDLRCQRNGQGENADRSTRLCGGGDR